MNQRLRRSQPRTYQKQRSCIIPAEAAIYDPAIVRIIGTDAGDGNPEESPAVIIEQADGRIVRIMVTCPCGREAEVHCEDDDASD